MKYKNSFFKIEIKEDGTYLVIYPPVSDGKALETKEVTDFLDSRGCYGFEIKKIREMIDATKEKPSKMKVCDNKIEPFDESARVMVSEDRMTAYIRFYPPSTDGNLMDKRDILEELEHNNIKHGIVTKVLDIFVAARQYCLDIPIAKGTKPTPAKDSKIEYFFNTRPLAKPKVLEDGSVDFHNLNIFTKVKQGDLLARLTPHVEGIKGKDVYGVDVASNKPKVLFLKYGRNISINEDKTEIVSNVDGDVVLTDDTVFVEDTYTVAADVDVSTGNIEYDGNVLVNGTVKSGFSVKAKGNVQINGVVEAAEVCAGGNIVIKRGVQGMGKGILKAGGDVCAQFFESTKVKAEGNIISGSILHSTINAGGKIIVSGRKGFIVGGEVKCSSALEVNTIGNKMETQTIIKVGVNPGLLDQIKAKVIAGDDLSQQIDEIKTYLDVYKRKVKSGATLSPEKLKQIKSFSDQLKSLVAEKAENDEKLSKLRDQLEFGRKGTVKVYGYAFRGACIYISSQVYNVKDRDAHCIYKIVDGDIKPGVL